MGPVVIIDTPGFDDEGALGELRVKKTREILNRADCAVLVVDSVLGKTKADEEMLSLFKEKQLPYLIAYNKWELLDEKEHKAKEQTADEKSVFVSAETNYHIQELKERIAGLVKEKENGCRLVGDFLKPLDLVVLVVPIDKAAPKGRLILPQQQAIRDILEAGAMSVVVRDTELLAALKKLGRDPDLVITDSQAFSEVAEVVPDHVLLTSFSVLMARYKGFLDAAASGVKAVNQLQDGDRILISEGCTHHRQCNDIGTVKIPAWIKKYTGKNVIIETSSGRSFPEDLSGYRLVIHCGGCMLNEREVRYRMQCAGDAGVPFTNYGMVIAQMKGILERSMEIFRKVQ